MRRPALGKTQLAILAAAICSALGALLAGPVAAGAASTSTNTAAASPERAEIARVERYWTPARMRSARPLELGVGDDGAAALRLGAAEPAAATISGKVAEVLTPDVLPYAVNGRIFLRQAGERAFCSGTAINSPSRQLVLTAGHCVATGPRRNGPNIMSNFMEFVPAYTGGLAPFGAFVARRGKIFALPQWKKHANFDFDMGAFLTHPNFEGVNVADAVGGGATIVTDQPREESFQTFGYPGETRQMHGCESRYLGKDRRSYFLPGPPTQVIGCPWIPGSSGGGWLIGEGSEIDGLTSYVPTNGRALTFGPYFSKVNIGQLVKGL